jgi:hypothetical protein
MPLQIPASNLSTWTKLASYYYYYPASGKDSDNHLHVGVENASADPLTIKFVSVKVGGSSTNLGPGNAITEWKFKTSGATWPDEPTKTRYMNALRAAGLIA